MGTKREMVEWNRPDKNFLTLMGVEGLGIGFNVGILRCPNRDLEFRPHTAVLIYESFLEEAKNGQWTCLRCGTTLQFEERRDYPPMNLEGAEEVEVNERGEIITKKKRGVRLKPHTWEDAY